MLAAVDGALLAKMRNGGSACTAANRFYVHASLHDEFVARMSAALARMPVGPGLGAAAVVLILGADGPALALQPLPYELLADI